MLNNEIKEEELKKENFEKNQMKENNETLIDKNN